MKLIKTLFLHLLCLFPILNAILPEKAPGARATPKTLVHNALIEATRKGHEEKAKKALSSMSPNITTIYGVTPLMFASYFGYVNLVRILLAHKADVALFTRSNQDFSFGRWLSTKTNKTTALMLAAVAGKLEIVYVLLKAGALVNAQDSNGQTALLYSIMGDQNWPHCPLSANRKKIVELLLEFGANATHPDNNGLDALYYYSCVAGLVPSFDGQFEKDPVAAEQDDLLLRMR